MANGEPLVFEGKVEPNDIRQGALGDCYFLSSLSVQAEYGDRVRKLFVNTTYNEEGLYAVNLTKNGEKI